MAENEAVALAEYSDGNGNTFQLNEEDAKRLGYTKVTTKVVDGDAAERPPVRRASTK